MKYPRVKHALPMAALSAILAIQAQPQGKNAPVFEVASVRVGAPIPIGENYINLGTVSHGTLTLANTTLADCLRFAYSLTSDSLLAGPDWIKSKEYRYAITAKAAPETPREELLRMLQSLLTERFKLALHRESRELNYYALLPGKKGPRIQLGKEGDPSASCPPGLFCITRPQISMMMLATLISRFELHATVLDMTELNGLFGVKLEWSPGVNPNADAPAGPSIFTAVQEQLGLRLEARKGPVEVLVIDRAEKTPVEN